MSQSAEEWLEYMFDQREQRRWDPPLNNREIAEFQRIYQMLSYDQLLALLDRTELIADSIKSPSEDELYSIYYNGINGISDCSSRYMGRSDEPYLSRAMMNHLLFFYDNPIDFWARGSQEQFDICFELQRVNDNQLRDLLRTLPEYQDADLNSYSRRNLIQLFYQAIVTSFNRRRDEIMNTIRDGLYLGTPVVIDYDPTTITDSSYLRASDIGELLDEFGIPYREDIDLEDAFDLLEAALQRRPDKLL